MPKPLDFFSPSEAFQKTMRQHLKSNHDLGKTLGSLESPIQTLIVEGFDAEQIWQQIELTNKGAVKRLLPVLEVDLTGLEPEETGAGPEPVAAPIAPPQAATAEEGPESESSADDSSDVDAPVLDEPEAADAAPDAPEAAVAAEDADAFVASSSSGDEASDAGGVAEDSTEDGAAQPNTEEGIDRDAMDDMDHEQQLDHLEKLSGDLDAMMGQHFPGDEAGEGGAGESSGDEDDEHAEALAQEAAAGARSSHEKAQAAIAARIAELEERNLAKRSWHHMGEASNKSRPKDSLLEVSLDFAAADKLKPVITEEYTETLEDLIIERIKEAMFDDVERKAAPKAPKKRKRLVEVSSEKCEMGLAELYEKEFVEKATGETEEEQELTKEQKEIAELKAELFYQLDALSNFHFTPVRPKLQLEITPNVAAVQAEEKIPMAVSTAMARAPEEVYRPDRHEKVGESERTQGERKALSLIHI